MSSSPIYAGALLLEGVAYLYDGTLEGLLSAVFLAYERHEDPLDVVKEREYEPRLGQSSLFVETDFGRAERVRRGMRRVAGGRTFEAVRQASLCDDRHAGTAIYRFIRYVMSRPADRSATSVLDELANPVVSDVVALAKHASNEAENMRQFVRFSHLENGLWYAHVRPNAAVVPLVMGYFSSRLNDQPFIIFDERHGMAGVYDGRSWQLVIADAVDVPDASEHDKLMQEAWKRFYDSLSIDDRYNPELRRHFMPVRLWNDLPELAPSNSAAPAANALTRIN